ncbi:PAS domain-containing protein [Duganella sp. FT92W]|uniref:PAS domain-containing protein n=1 Tax=Pseudoduganella rivuli TaxID=2666085 RepID=A0A7X2IQD5_9BURK|nr:PAS domain-containing methyl-accepting chemotaxis protein [Pseudoduganella rivuli]MRV74053.1 PAS domain-containing protein [Pseudoduganella rivuli]
MRTNLPVTPTEYQLSPGQTLVSTTDAKGRILYCNQAFIEVSGFSKEELLGQPHNVVRHPDMPEEAYRDMWQTIGSGKPWSAPVKNRRKNGDYYWVMANATPLLDQGKPIGYMSVRTAATREQIDAAERLYAQMRSDKQRGQQTVRLSAGRVLHASWQGRLAEAVRFGLSAKMLIVLLTVVLVNTGIAALIPADMPLGGLLLLLLKLATLFCGWQYLRQLMIKPLDDLIGVANRLAAGDLTRAVARTRNDQLGELEQAFGQLSVNILSIVRDARDQSVAMLNGTREIAQGNLDLSGRTEVQASNLEKTASAVEQITGTVRQTAEAADEADRLAGEVSAIAERSRVAVDDVSSTMQEIQSASGHIGEITQVIDSIAFQTNILALNAAVEAARAGEQGRGFAVVATEVRALAQRTSSAAKEIKQLIDDSSTKVQQGHAKTEAAQSTLYEAVDGVRRVSALVNEIRSASHEQLIGISNINAAVTELDNITQQNSALVEQITASASQLAEVAQSVTETVQVFQLDHDTALRPDAVALRRAGKSTQLGRS